MEFSKFKIGILNLEAVSNGFTVLEILKSYNNRSVIIKVKIIFVFMAAFDILRLSLHVLIVMVDLDDNDSSFCAQLFIHLSSACFQFAYRSF